jgi:hypothetical protein
MTEMIPGGRWLVANGNNGKVFLYDLHSPFPQPHGLFDPGENDEKDGTPDPLTQINMWIDHVTSCSDSGILRFRVVSWRWGLHIGKDPMSLAVLLIECLVEEHVARIQIHEVDVYANGGEVHSSAKRIFEKRSYQSGMRKCGMALSQEYLAEIQMTGRKQEGNRRWKLVTYQYAACELSGGPRDEVSLLVGKTNDMIVVSQTSLLVLVFSKFTIHKA